MNRHRRRGHRIRGKGSHAVRRGTRRPLSFHRNMPACPYCENHCTIHDTGCGKGKTYFNALKTA